MSSKQQKNKSSSGLRILWIPGRRKSDHKGRYDSTSKHVSYKDHQKKNQMWSLGGSKAHSDLIKASPDTALLDGPSVSSSLAPATCAAGAIGAVGTALKCPTLAADKPFQTLSAEGEINLPSTPNSSTSTAPLISLPSSPEPQAVNSSAIMATKTALPPVIITTTTTAEIVDENRFALLGPEDDKDSFDIFDLPSPPREGATHNGTPDTTPDVSLSTSPHPDSTPPTTNTGTLVKKKKHKHHNNNQGDVNSIESVSDRIPSSDFGYIDELMDDIKKAKSKEQQSQNEHPQSKHKKKKKTMKSKRLDQLDGVSAKSNKSEKSEDDDEKMVKCLYYTLMCCECTIS